MSKSGRKQSHFARAKTCVIVLGLCLLGLSGCSRTKTLIKYVDWHEGESYHNEEDGTISKSVNVVSCAAELNKLWTNKEKWKVLALDYAHLDSLKNIQLQKLEEEIFKLKSR